MQNRIDKLQQRLRLLSIEAYLISDVFNLRYSTGFSGTSGLFLVTPDDGWLITDFRYQEQVRGQLPELKLILSDSATSLHTSLANKLKSLGIKELYFEENAITYAGYHKLKQELEPVSLLPSSGVVEKLRIIKDDDELTLLRHAANIADQALVALLPMIKPGITELQLANHLESLLRDLGAESSSFTTIVVSGHRSALPHGRPSDKRLATGELITIDFGALVSGYCSDITRTFMLGRPAAKQREIYDVVLGAQQNVLSQIKAGMSAGEVDSLARTYITAHGYGDFFGHATGHGLGLEVHEAPCLGAGVKSILEPGMVVTVEPGIYISELGGVRIEDDILITENGCEVLTTASKEWLL